MRDRIASFGVWALSALTATGLLFGVPVLLVLAGDGWPGPHQIPTWDQVTEFFGQGAMTDQRIVAIVVMAGWLTWVHVVYVFFVEFIAAVRGRTPRQVKASALSQRAAQMLVAGLFRLGATSTAVFAVVGPPATVGLVAATVGPAGAEALPTVESTNGPLSVTRSVGSDVSIEYFSEVVESPRDGKVAYEVRDGDMLWTIAQTHLGDGFRYQQIFEASKGVRQPGADGRVITNPDLIWPGSILLLPGDATDIPPVEEAKIAAVYGPSSQIAPTTTTPATSEPAEAEAGLPGGGDASGAAADTGDSGEASGSTDRSLMSPPTVSVNPTEPETTGTPSEGLVAVPVSVEGPLRPTMTQIGFGATGVVLVVGLLRRVRRARLRRQTRLVSGEVPAPLNAEQQVLETEIRQGGDAEFVSFVGSAWASLSKRPLDTDNIVVPLVARLDGDRLQVQMSGVDRDVFAPWELEGDSEQFSVWELDRQEWQDYALPDEQPAAFPLLVPIAQRSFLNFEATGPVSLVGDSERRAGFVRAIGMERTGALEDGFDMRVSSTISDTIGMGTVQDPSTIAEQVGSWATATLDHLDSTNSASSFVVRAGADNAEPYSMMVICATEDLDEMGNVLAICGQRRLALSMIVVGRCTVEYVIDFDELDGITFGPTAMRDDKAAYIQIDLSAMVDDLVEAHSEVQVLPPDQAGLPQMFATPPTVATDYPVLDETEPEHPTDDDNDDNGGSSSVVEVTEQLEGLPTDVDEERAETVNDPPPNTPQDVAASNGSVDAVDETVIDLTGPDAPDGSKLVGDSVAPVGETDNKPVRLRVLGPVTVEGVEPDLSSRELSLVTMLAINGEQTASTLRDALWGNQGVSDEGWWQMCRRLRKKLSAESFPVSDSGRFVLHGVTTDFFEFQTETTRARNSGSADRRVDHYLRALALISGEPLGVPGNEQYWAWVHSTEQGMLNHIEIQISDAVRGCVEAAVKADRLADAAMGCRQGLNALPLNEPVLEMYVEVLLAQGKHSAAQRLVEDYERQAFDLFEGEPSTGPREVLTSRVA